MFDTTSRAGTAWLFFHIRLRNLIEQTKRQAAMTVNAGMTLMYWHIGERINREVLGGERADYGKQVVAKLARQLTEEYGGNQYSLRNLRRMMQFAEVFPDFQIVTPLVSQLSWSHFLQVISIEDELKREFYLTMAADQRWSKHMDEVHRYVYTMPQKLRSWQEDCVALGGVSTFLSKG